MITSTLHGLTTSIDGYKVHHSSTAYRAISRRTDDIQRVSTSVSSAAMLSTRETGSGYYFSLLDLLFAAKCKDCCHIATSLLALCFWMNSLMQNNNTDSREQYSLLGINK